MTIQLQLALEKSNTPESAVAGCRAMGCDEGIMGNNGVSPIATTLGQPNGSGGYTTLPLPCLSVTARNSQFEEVAARFGRRKKK